MKSKHFLSKLMSWIILSILSFYILIPLYSLIVCSFKTPLETTTAPLALPSHLLFSNYSAAWKDASLGESLLNSLIFAGSSVIIAWILGGPAAYALSKKGKGISQITLFILICTSLPMLLMIIPLYLWFIKLHMNNIIGALIVNGGIALPFSILLLRSFMVSIPIEYEEAALLDGASRWQIFWDIIFPITLPAFLTVGLLNFVSGWNAFLIPLTFLQDPSQYTGVISFYTLSGQYTSPWGEMYAAALIISLPVLALLLWTQKYFVKGLTLGGLK